MEGEEREERRDEGRGGEDREGRNERKGEGTRGEERIKK